MKASSTNKIRKKPETSDIDPRFVPVVNAFAKHRNVSRENRKGFGFGALKVNGKIFAMMSSKGNFVVKLSKKRVDDLVSSGQGECFDPGHGRLMREWIALEAGSPRWVELAREAYEFVERGKL